MYFSGVLITHIPDIDIDKKDSHFQQSLESVYAYMYYWSGVYVYLLLTYTIS